MQNLIGKTVEWETFHLFSWSWKVPQKAIQSTWGWRTHQGVIQDIEGIHRRPDSEYYWPRNNPCRPTYAPTYVDWWALILLPDGSFVKKNLCSVKLINE